MRTILTLIAIVCTICIRDQLNAQSPSNNVHNHIPVQTDPSKDRIEYKGFRIQLIPAMDGNYGYDITKGGKMIVHQYQNPLPGTKLTNREDAFIVAKWVAEQYIKTQHIHLNITPAIQKQLKLSSN